MIGREDMQRTESGMWVDRRKFLKIGGVGLLGTILAACGVGSETTTTTAATTTTAGTGTTLGTTTTVIDKIVANLNKVVMGDFNPNYAAQWSYSLAQALGYLEEYGIEDLERLLTDEYIAGLIGGSIDITHGDTNVFLGSAEASGEPIKIISMYRINEWQILGVRAGIETAEDLIGGTITGGQLEGRNTFVQKKIVTALGLDPETDVQFVPTSGGSDGRLQAVLAGTVDGASLFPRHRFAIEEAGGKFLYAEVEPAPQEGFGAMAGWIEENYDTVLAWVVADLRARQFMFDPANKDQAYQEMIDLGYEIPPEFIELYQVELDQISEDGGFELDTMQPFLDELAITGDIPEGIDWKKHFDFTALWEAQDILGIPRRPASL